MRFNFIEKLIEDGSPDRPSFSPRNHLHVGGYRLSIQASEFHYCSPRKNLSSLNKYTTMEMAILKDDDFVNPTTDEYFRDFNKLDELTEFMEDMGNTVIFSYVPIELIEELYLYLEGKLWNFKW